MESKRPDFSQLSHPVFINSLREKPYEKLRGRVHEIAVYKGGGGLGDLVVGMPFFRQLRDAFPQARIRYMGSIYPRFENIFQALPYFNGYISYERPNKGKGMKQYARFWRQWQGKIDLLIDTQRRWETSFWLAMLRPRYMLSASPLLSTWGMPVMPYKGMHILEQLCTLTARLGIPLRDEAEVLAIPEQYRRNAQQLLRNVARPFVVLLPSSGMEYKNWPAEYCARLGDLLSNAGYSVILLGGPWQLPVLQDVAGRMKHPPLIPALQNAAFAEELLNDAAVMEQSSLVVGNDSGGMHLASVLGVLTVTLFGPTSPRKFSPIGPRCVIFYKPPRCSPCRFKCTNPAGKECMTAITPEEVFEACVKQLKLKEKGITHE